MISEEESSEEESSVILTLQSSFVEEHMITQILLCTSGVELG